MKLNLIFYLLCSAIIAPRLSLFAMHNNFKMPTVDHEAECRMLLGRGSFDFLTKKQKENLVKKYVKDSTKATNARYTFK